MAQFARPISDITNPANWNGDYTDIDEISANDSDFGWSNDKDNLTYETLLSDIDPGAGSGTVTIRSRASRCDGGVPNDTSGSASLLQVLLMQGAVQIAEIRANAEIGAWEDISYELSGGEVSSITDWSIVSIRYIITGGGGSPTNRRGVALSWAEMEGPDYVLPTNIPISVNISDVWKEGIDGWVNISDTWKKVVAAWVNVGDTWKQIF